MKLPRGQKSAMLLEMLKRPMDSASLYASLDGKLAITKTALNSALQRLKRKGQLKSNAEGLWSLR